MAQPEDAVESVLDSSVPVSLEEEEKQSIIEALKATNGMVYGERGAAKLLGIHPEKLRSRMRKYDLKRPEKKRGGKG
jgi:transcriptional regulator with GAF, ATPase, and Fis domain